MNDIANAFNQELQKGSYKDNSKTEFQEIPEGTYHAEVLDATYLTLSEKVEITLKLTDQGVANRRAWASFNLNHEVGRSMFAKTLADLGFKITSFDEALAALEQMKDMRVEAFIKYKDGKDKFGAPKRWMQTYINKQLSVSESNNDDIPF